MITKPLHVVFAIDISSRSTPEQMSAMLDFMRNTAETFDTEQVKFAIVTYHAQSKTVRHFGKDDSTRNLDEQLNTIRKTNLRESGTVRNLDTLFREIDQRVFDKTNFKDDMLENAVVIVMATGSFNPSRIGESKQGYERLMTKRGVDVVFVDVGNNEGNHHQILGPSVSNYTAGHVGDVPALFSKISHLLQRTSGTRLMLASILVSLVYR